MSNIINTTITEQIKKEINIKLDFDLDEIVNEDKYCIGINTNNVMYKVILFVKSFKNSMGETRYNLLTFSEYPNRKICQRLIIYKDRIKEEVEANIHLNINDETKIERLDYDGEMDRILTGFMII